MRIALIGAGGQLGRQIPADVRLGHGDVDVAKPGSISGALDGAGADGVILTGGCPLCHRVSAIIQREIEMTGIPTVLITVAPEQSRQAGPPRALAPYHFKLGNSLGGPHQDDLQRKVLMDALRRWEAREEPGQAWVIVYPEYDSSDWQPVDLQEG